MVRVSDESNNTRALRWDFVGRFCSLIRDSITVQVLQCASFVVETTKATAGCMEFAQFVRTFDEPVASQSVIMYEIMACPLETNKREVPPTLHRSCRKDIET